MNLLKYNFNYSPRNIFINNLELLDFLKLFNGNEPIQIVEFYGESFKNPIDEGDFGKSMVLKEFIARINHYESLFIYNLAFTIQDLRVDIMDCHEYNISTTNSDLTVFLNNILKEVIQVDLEYRDLLPLENQYLLFERGNLIKSFENFDDYISYDKS